MTAHMMDDSDDGKPTELAAKENKDLHTTSVYQKRRSYRVSEGHCEFRCTKD